MNFKEARDKIKEGKKVRRKSWYYQDYSLPVSKEEQHEKIPFLTFEDIDADDWEVFKKVKFCKQCKQEIFK